MRIIPDPDQPRGIGARIALRGRVFGFRLSLDEVVTRYEPPLLKQWETTGEPRLLVIGRYRMGFETRAAAEGTKLRVAIDYNRPRSLVSWWLAALFGRIYARWCTAQIVRDATNARFTVGDSKV